MKRIACVLIAWLALTGLVLAGDVDLPAELKLEPGRLGKLAAESKGEVIRWVNPSPGMDLIPSESGRWVIVSAMKPGAYPVFAYTALGGKPTEAVRCLVVVGTPSPDPQPTPPTPTPPPGPTPDPAPIPEAGFRVLMVYETGEVQKLPPAQGSVLYSKQIRDYLDSKCVVGRDGKTREWRIWDKDIDTTNETAIWQSAMKRDRKSVPWIVISNGKTGFEGPLPASVSEALALLKKYGGE
jgi:hypothetical protein